jgi:predicted DNA binding CopG/RHH family protein
MNNETQIRTFISETVSYINADTLADFQQQLWDNYEANNAEYHPDFQQDFNRADFDFIASESFTGNKQEPTVSAVKAFAAEHGYDYDKFVKAFVFKDQLQLDVNLLYLDKVVGQISSDDRIENYC